MKPLIVANWKMNPQTSTEAKKLFNLVKREIKNIKKVKVVICPPFVYLPILKDFSPGRGERSLPGIAFGAQDCFWENRGAFTGEISPAMLKNLQAEYVIIGHSERRQFLNETNEQINKKIKKVLSLKLKPILCIGETKTEREKEKKPQILRTQIKEGLKEVSRKEIKNLVIAYEPVWAIGTGENCSINETMSSTLFIRKIVSGLYSRFLAENLPILYGGSVTSENAEAYIKEAYTNGLLVGGASLDAKEFIKIIKSI